jgi:hypothetical protein
MAKPGPHGKDKQRCGARVRHRHGFCRKWPVPGKTRCRFHGGCSTGALTDEAKPGRWPPCAQGGSGGTRTCGPRRRPARSTGSQRQEVRHTMGDAAHVGAAADGGDAAPSRRTGGARTTAPATTATPRPADDHCAGAGAAPQGICATATTLALAGGPRPAPLGPGGRGAARSGEEGAQGETEAGFLDRCGFSKADLPPRKVRGMRVMRSLDVSCWNCHHRPIRSSNPWPDDMPVPTFGPHGGAREPDMCPMAVILHAAASQVEELLRPGYSPNECVAQRPYYLRWGRTGGRLR